MKSQTRKFIMTGIVGLIALWSISAMYSNAPFYINVTKATQEMEITLVEFQWEGDTTIILTFEFDNNSSLDITLNSVIFNLYANSIFMGNFDMREKQTISPGKTPVRIVIEVQERYIDRLSSDQSIGWYVYGGAVIELPVEDTTYNIQINEEWVT
jgi:LEA14-like dessication related protein